MFRAPSAALAVVDSTIGPRGVRPRPRLHDHVTGIDVIDQADRFVDVRGLSSPVAIRPTDRARQRSVESHVDARGRLTVPAHELQVLAWYQQALRRVSVAIDGAFHRQSARRTAPARVAHTVGVRAGRRQRIGARLVDYAASPATPGPFAPLAATQITADPLVEEPEALGQKTSHLPEVEDHQGNSDQAVDDR